MCSTRVNLFHTRHLWIWHERYLRYMDMKWNAEMFLAFQTLYVYIFISSFTVLFISSLASAPLFFCLLRISHVLLHDVCRASPRYFMCWSLSRVTLYTAGHLHTAVPHCSHSRAPIVHTAVPRENNEHGCVYLRCRAVCKLPGCVEGHPWLYMLCQEWRNKDIHY